jgi:ABC-type multidrug transport system fused ATPase/permease subunit
MEPSSKVGRRGIECVFNVSLEVSFAVNFQTISSIFSLQQVADSGISLILLLSFSLVLSGASVYIVNERVGGEKLQQKLCGVDFKTYWGVCFIWDYAVYCTAIALAVIVFKIFNIPTYVDLDNLPGIVLLLFFYGFASIPAVHLFEKLFNEASFANMSLFCLNVIIALTTLSIILMIDVFSENYEHEKIRNFLNRLFLVFPQHALADGMIEICKNYITSKIFMRYYINTYKSPVTSDLLHPHFMSLFVMGVIFMVLNFIIESRLICRVLKSLPKRENQNLSVVTTIQNTLTKDGKVDDSMSYALKVNNLSKSYNGNTYAVNDVSFKVNINECYGLLGL